MAKAGVAAGSAVDPNSKQHASLMSDAKLRQLYSAMLRSRMLEERACVFAANQRLGMKKIPEGGLEATAVGCTFGLRRHDAVSSARHAQIGQWLPPCSLPHPLAKLYRQHEPAAKFPAGGAALNPGDGPAFRLLEDVLDRADQLKKSDNVVVTFLHPELHSREERQEAFAIAAKNSLPILFVELETRPAKSVESNPNPHGLPAPANAAPRIPVDKHDVVAVYRVAYESIQRARRRGGPTVIDCQAYRLDVATPLNGNRRGNPKQEDPIDRMQHHLERKGLFDLAWRENLTRKFADALDGALR